MYEIAISNELIENSPKPSNLIPDSYLLVSKTCGLCVGGWWYKLCTTTAFYTRAYIQQLASWVQKGIYAQFLRFYSSVLSTYFSKLSSLLIIIYTPFPQPLLLKKLS